MLRTVSSVFAVFLWFNVGAAYTQVNSEGVLPVNSVPPLQHVATARPAASLITIANPLGAESSYNDSVLRAEVRNGRITGVVFAAQTGAPLSSVQVYLAGTSIGSLSSSTGTFSLENVPPGSYTVVAQRIGFQETRRDGVSVSDGSTTTLNLTMNEMVLALQGIVATGLVDPVEGVRAPIAVARVSREMMPVVASGGAAIQNLQGRVAGVTINRATGQPGEGVTVQLRTATTVRTDGAGSPLIVVDGVILGGSGTISTSDIEAMDIESIEVIRGAAASSLYGSRAAAGVIAITTARGNALPVGETRFTARSEMGFSQNVRNVGLANHHGYLMDPTHSYYVDLNGNQVTRSQRTFPAGVDIPLAYAFMDKPFPGGVYDNVSAITRPGRFRSNSISFSGNAEASNFAISLSDMHEQGSLVGNDGFRRTSMRVNLDHRASSSFAASVSMSHSRTARDNFVGSPFNDALSGPRDVDLSVKDAEGNYVQQPDPQIPYQNPLWTNATRESDEEGSRTMASIAMNWSPLTWLSASASVGYDRNDTWSRSYVPKGTPANVGAVGELDGSISFSESERRTMNVEGQLTARRDFGPLNLRTTVRGLTERDSFRSGNRSGEGFILMGVPQLSNISNEDQRSTSNEQEILATGYLWDTAFDYDGKYILTVLGRRDGSSLFGANNRWHNYYRVAGAWRIGQESWFNVPNVDELKLSIARGTAGGRPGFAAQYEVWGLSGAGVPIKSSLGNPELAPERTTENEFSLSTILFGRYGATLTHARQVTTDQLVQALLPAYTGYPSQWVNAGTVAGHTTEFEFEAQLIQEADLGWTTGIVADYKYAEITEWPIACQANQAWRYNCQGEPIYGTFSWWNIKDHEGLKQHRGGEAWASADQFQVNDEGWLVWVGDKNYWEGLVNGQVQPGTWGTISPLIGGRTYQWGVPIVEQDDNGNNRRQLVGRGSPTNIGWTNNIRYKVFNFHAHLQGAMGGAIGNRRSQDLANQNTLTAPRLEQFGKPDELKKPIAYHHGNDGGISMDTEDGAYLKLRTLSTTVNLNQGQLQNLGVSFLRIRNLTIGLIGRDIFTVTNYKGFDPETSFNLSNRLVADQGGLYPPTRSITAEFTVTF